MVGYLLGFAHLTFYANGPVRRVEEVMVEERHRRHGIGRQLVDDFAEGAAGGCRFVSLATSRAPEFYQAIGFASTATYFRRFR